MAKKKDPLWRDLLQEVDTAPEKIHWLSTRTIQRICDDAEKILKRPPRASDMDSDLAELLVRKWVKTMVHRPSIENRIERLKRLCELIRSRFNRRDLVIEWASFPLTKREYKTHMAFEVATPVEQPAISKRELDAGMSPDAFKTLLTDVMNEYRRERLTGKSPHTGRLMDVAIGNFSRFLCRPAVLGDLNKDTIIGYLAHMLSSGALSRASIRTNQERLHALWRFAVQKHWLLDPPTVAIVTVPERTPDSWSPDEMVALLNAAQSMPGLMRDTAVPWKLFWSTLIYFLYDTAERIGAVMMVRHDDISGGWVTVRAEYRKGQTRDKRFKLRQCTLDNIAKLRKLQAADVELVFDFPYCVTYLWTRFNKVLEQAELPTNRRSKYHKIRRSCASQFEAAGGDATKLLDHNNRATTKKYLDPSVTNEKQLADIVAGIGETMPETDSTVLNQLRKLLGA